MTIKDNALNLLNPKLISRTNPNGASIMIHPRPFIPVGPYKFVIAPELANQYAVIPEIVKATNIKENTLDTKFLESALLSILAVWLEFINFSSMMLSLVIIRQSIQRNYFQFRVIWLHVIYSPANLYHFLVGPIFQ